MYHHDIKEEGILDKFMLINKKYKRGLDNKNIAHLDQCLSHIPALTISSLCITVFNYNNLKTMLTFLIYQKEGRKRMSIHDTFCFVSMKPPHENIMITIT